MLKLNLLNMNLYKIQQETTSIKKKNVNRVFEINKIGINNVIFKIENT